MKHLHAVREPLLLDFDDVPITMRGRWPKGVNHHLPYVNPKKYGLSQELFEGRLCAREFWPASSSSGGCQDEECSHRHAPLSVREVILLLKIGAEEFVRHQVTGYINRYPYWRKGQAPIRPKFLLSTIVTQKPQKCNIRVKYEDPSDLLSQWDITELFHHWQQVYEDHKVEELFLTRLTQQV